MAMKPSGNLGWTHPCSRAHTYSGGGDFVSPTRFYYLPSIPYQDAGIDIPRTIVEADPVHGQVLAVDSETDLVVISIGNNAHVTKGMKLSVYREDNFVGSLSVISVYPDMSSARILRELTQREVQPGDNVTNQF